ncbi:MAG: HesA/MoeB/ThiF family protein [Candidatus Odinarchaeia archaeon]
MPLGNKQEYKGGFDFRNSDGRYSRQKLLEHWNQELIRKSSILIAGLGSLGCYSAVNFTLMGVGRLILIDFDTVEISNLNRQLIFTEKDIGKPKVEVAKKKLAEINPNVELIAYNDDIRNIDVSVFRSADVILDSLDSFEIKRWLNSLAVNLRKPLIHAGVYGWWGNIQVILPYVNACLECQPLIPRKRLQHSCSLPGEKRRMKSNKNIKKIPMVSTVAMVISGLQSQECLKILLGRKEQLIDNYIFYDGLSGSFTSLKIEKNPDCIVCGGKFTPKEIEVLLDKNTSFHSITEKLKVKFNLSNPKYVYKSKIIDADRKISDYSIIDGDVIYILDKNITGPLKLKCKFK